MNKWPQCKECNHYFPPCTDEHHITGKCDKCLGHYKYKEEGFHASISDRVKK